ncbi:hypothetical protein ACFXHD_27650, partial [Streptomyces hydrogenans]
VTPVTPAGETPAKEQAPLLGEKADRVPGLRTDLPVAARPAGKAAARAAAEGPAAHVAVEIADRAAALLDVVFGRARPEGRLPFELPRSMAAVRAARPDVPNDTEDPVFPYGHGLEL